eukprot:CAMPEP_0183730356 /NCGR_PEP_ID=MMETSP0737-20130205/32647_1 /TAXON_ID=385413 /ORGANISM="Thalassiosira miniscula, Strain CCMP1093" /LENGTH=53 /DNA_ID=CAMNT_0025962829 /DNA_START=13 /DNA_END=171 /DNA_ORIENTATION=+
MTSATSSAQVLCPTAWLTLALGGMTWATYEILIRINDACHGIGAGRLSATSFV